MATAENIEVEVVYMNVLAAIDKAIDLGQHDRAQAMAKRGALGSPRIIPEAVANSKEHHGQE
jgi:hypothetical protein